MGDPLIDPADLAIYLSDTTINTVRAWAMITDAQALCESVISPLPAAAAVVVKRVAARGYASVTGPRQQQLGVAGDPYAQMPPGVGSVELSEQDERDLRRLAGGGGAFSIDLLPADFTPPVDWAPTDELAEWDLP